MFLRKYELHFFLPKLILHDRLTSMKLPLHIVHFHAVTLTVRVGQRGGDLSTGTVWLNEDV